MFKQFYLMNSSVQFWDDLGVSFPLTPKYINFLSFQYVGQALLSVLEEGLGEAFTPALKAAWTDLYAIITDIMVTAITDYNADKKDNKTNKEY